MTWRRGSLDIDEQLAARLKQVRDEQPRQDPDRFRRTREVVLQRARRTRIVRTTQATLIATAVVLGAFAVPNSFTSNEHVGPSTRRMATGEERVWTADPWVVASARRSVIQGDGWVPRGPSS
jgi:hypothetical protein